MQWMGLMIVCCGIVMKMMGMLGVSMKKIKELTVKTDCEIDWLRQIESDMLCVSSI